MTLNNDTSQYLQETASRIHELREIYGYSTEEMARLTEIDEGLYLRYESGQEDLPFTFIHKCALTFGVEIIDLMEGRSTRLTSYTVTRKGGGVTTAQEDGILIKNMAPLFKKKIAEPYWVKYDYSEAQQNAPIHTTTHKGQEFDLVIEGKLKVQVGDHTEILEEGDSIYYSSSTPHGMIAMDGKDCTFLAVILPGEETDQQTLADTITANRHVDHLLVEEFVTPVEDENGFLQSISFQNTERFNFAFDIVDGLAQKDPDKLAMVHLATDGVTERRFTFGDMSRLSNQAANYFKSLGIHPGDKVMLVLRRNWEFWPAILGLCKLGAIAIPATDQLLEKDYVYRFDAADVSALIATGFGKAYEHIDNAISEDSPVRIKIMAGMDGRKIEGWHDFDEELLMFSDVFPRRDDSPKGNDTMLMFFTSGTSGYPKIAAHTHAYPLGHFITGRYWHCAETDGLHFTISDTGWGKALWGKLYGQWMSEAAVFTYDFDRFDAKEILSMFARYGITSFCAPPTMYRFMLREGLDNYDLSSLHHVTTAGEAMNPEVFSQFKKATGLSIMEGFGQTETTLSICNLVGTTPKVGSMGKPSPMYKIDLMKPDGTMCKPAETGEIVIKTSDGIPCGLFKGYYLDEPQTNEAWHDGWYHTGDTAWKDEDGYYWYVGRTDDVIKSSGYRIGPFEIESVICELPYVLECGVNAAPDPIRGQVVKASIVLSDDKEPSEELKKEIQEYVKKRTAPYKYPRIIVFRDSLPKTFNGKLIRHLL